MFYVLCPCAEVNTKYAMAFGIDKHLNDLSYIATNHQLSARLFIILTNPV